MAILSPFAGYYGIIIWAMPRYINTTGVTTKFRQLKIAYCSASVRLGYRQLRRGREAKGVEKATSVAQRLRSQRFATTFPLRHGRVCISYSTRLFWTAKMPATDNDVVR